MMRLVTLIIVATLAASDAREPEPSFPTWEQVGPKYQIRKAAGGFQVCYKAWDSSVYDCNPCVFPTREEAERVRDVVEAELHSRYQAIKDSSEAL